MMSGIYEEDKTYEDGKQFADDKKLLVRFFVDAVKHPKKSDVAGRAIYYDQEFIQIIIPGSRDISTYALDDHYKARFKEQYNKWKLDPANSTPIEGTILAELTWMTKSQIAELNYCNIHTVEQLANLPDALAQQFMGNFKLRERAKNFLAAAAGEAPAMKLQAALEERDNHIQVLERKVEELTAAFEKLSAEQNKRR